MTISTPGFLARLDARDRALFRRWARDVAVSRRVRAAWTTLTHLGGSLSSIAAAVVPLFAGGFVAAAARHALASLVTSHLLVQLVKRTVGRPRPSRGTSCTTLVQEPDRFSFPSGHAAAAMSVALAYGLAFPHLAAPLIALAFVVGLSRVVLAVHYPGDVLVGQIIAIGTTLSLAGMR